MAIAKYICDHINDNLEVSFTKEDISFNGFVSEIRHIKEILLTQIWCNSKSGERVMLETVGTYNDEWNGVYRMKNRIESIFFVKIEVVSSLK